MRARSADVAGPAEGDDATWSLEGGLNATAAMVPWRPEPQIWLARTDGDPDHANAEMERLVRQRPWDPDIRLAAAWVAQSTERPDLVERYLTEQLLEFPGDRTSVDAVWTGDWSP